MKKKSEKIWKIFFSYFQKKGLSIALNWKNDEFEPIWEEFISFEKKIKNQNFFSSFGVPKEESQIPLVPQRKKSEKIFFNNFQKKRSQVLWIERKCPHWWIWAYLRWIDNFWKKNLKKFFLAIFRKKVSIALNWKKVSIMMNLSKFENFWIFFSIFQKKGLNCSKLKESVQYDEFEHIWDELIIFEKKILKNQKKIFFSFFQKKRSQLLSELQVSIMVNLSIFEMNW